MPNKKGEKKVVDSVTVSPTVKKGLEKQQIEVETDQREKSIVIEEKVEVLIKEIVRIKPREFEAFKNALEEFVSKWDK
jgi:hypothetical protein